MKKIVSFLLITIIAVFSAAPLLADDFEFNQLEMKFKNFIRCELTRTDAMDHFNGKSFKITMIDLFDVQKESDLKIVTGAVECFVVDKYVMLYTAVGVKTLLGREQVLYFTIRNKDFSILSTELIKFPYKKRCKWSQYWIDTE